jgi:hypothetical protein
MCRGRRPDANFLTLPPANRATMNEVATILSWEVGRWMSSSPVHQPLFGVERNPLPTSVALRFAARSAARRSSAGRSLAGVSKRPTTNHSRH